jgi:hypothetical protein
MTTPHSTPTKRSKAIREPRASGERKKILAAKKLADKRKARV